jgi:hypothetical protein
MRVWKNLLALLLLYTFIWKVLLIADCADRTDYADSIMTKNLLNPRNPRSVLVLYGRELALKFLPDEAVQSLESDWKMGIPSQISNSGTFFRISQERLGKPRRWWRPP